MKTFRLFSMAVMTLAMAACSNSDDNETAAPAPTAEAGTVHFTATLPAPGSGATTRTTMTEGTGTDEGYLLVAWKAGDQIALCHNSSKDVVTLAAADINDDGSATISADINATDGEDVAVIYPADYVASVSGKFPTYNAKVYTAQDGTLDYIADNLDFRSGEGKIAASDGKATFKEDIEMYTPEIVVWKLTLTDGTNPLAATAVTVKVGGTAQAAAASTAKSDYYLALPPSLVLGSGDLTIEATVGSDTYTYTKAGGVTLAGGYYYQSTVTMAKPGPTAYTLAESTVGMVVGTDGNAYDAADKDNLPSGVTAAGMVAYKDGSDGLVIALADEASAMVWSTANSASGAAAHRPAVTGQAWKLPSKDEWKQMFSANGGNEDSYTGLNSAITTAGGTALQEEGSYWSSEEDGSENAYDVYLINGAAYCYSDDKGTEYLVRACLAF